MTSSHYINQHRTWSHLRSWACRPGGEAPLSNFARKSHKSWLPNLPSYRKPSPKIAFFDFDLSPFPIEGVTLCGISSSDLNTFASNTADWKTNIVSVTAFYIWWPYILSSTLAISMYPKSRSRDSYFPLWIPRLLSIASNSSQPAVPSTAVSVAASLKVGRWSYHALLLTVLALLDWIAGVQRASGLWRHENGLNASENWAKTSYYTRTNHLHQSTFFETFSDNQKKTEEYCMLAWGNHLHCQSSFWNTRAIFRIELKITALL